MSGEGDPITHDATAGQDVGLPSDAGAIQGVPGVEIELDTAQDSLTVDEKIRHEGRMQALVTEILLEHEGMEKGVAGLPTKFVRRWIAHRPQKPPRS